MEKIRTGGLAAHIVQHTFLTLYLKLSIFETLYVVVQIAMLRAPSKKKFSCNEKFTKLFKKRVFAESWLGQQMLTGFVVLS